jgi:hypothetical protein
MATYKLSRDGASIVKWEAPDGSTYELDLSQATPGQWHIINNSVGQAVMAYLTKPGQDGELVLTLEGSKAGIAATLLHQEDDRPRKLYFSTDGGNNNPLQAPAFQLKCEGVEGSPVQPWAAYQVLCVEIRG